MCTAIALTGAANCLGRNLDLPVSPGERVVCCPRRFLLSFRHLPPLRHHHAMIGMAHLADGCPLFYDAVSECGLAIAALSFPHACFYPPAEDCEQNVAPFELIPYILGACDSLDDARRLLSRIRLCDTPFSPALPNTPLHFMLASSEGCLVIESTRDGLHLYDNPVQVMTNSPPFPWHLQRLSDFMGLSCDPPHNRFSPLLPLSPYSFGMGALGLPGDLSSSSRFVRAAFARANSVSSGGQPLLELMHLLDFVAMPRGLVRLEDGACEYTVYTACMDLDTGVYTYKTYDDFAPRTAQLCRDPNACELLLV